jgi:hypothetical protein
MIENYRNGDMGKFELMADKFFRAGYGSVQFQGAQSTVLLSDMLSEFDEAFIVAVLHNSFEQWVQEATIMAEGGEVDSKKLVKTKWTDTGAAAKKYEGWVEEGVEFFNNQVQELKIVRTTAVSKRMEEEYLQKKKKDVEEKQKGPVKRSFQVSALNGLVAVEEVVVVGENESNESQSSIPNTVAYPVSSNKRLRNQMGGSSRREVSSESDQTSSLSGSHRSTDTDDEGDGGSSSYHEEYMQSRRHPV